MCKPLPDALIYMNNIVDETGTPWYVHSNALRCKYSDNQLVYSFQLHVYET